MIPWGAYAPRRARDPYAWLGAKGVTTRAQLRAELITLNVDPTTFPEAVICDYLAGLCLSVAAETSVNPEAANVVEQASTGTAPAAPRRGGRKPKASEPT